MRIKVRTLILFATFLAVVATVIAATLVYNSFETQNQRDLTIEATKKTRIISNLITGSMQIGDYNETVNVVSRLFKDEIISYVKIVNQYGDVILDLAKNKDRSIIVTEKIGINSTESDLGTLTVGYDVSYFENSAAKFKFQIISILIFAMIAVAMIAFAITRYVQMILSEFSRGLSELALGRSFVLNKKSRFADVRDSIQAFNETSRRVLEHKQLEVEKARLSATATFAAQVAHDIRSPLSALKIMEKEFNHLPSEKARLVKMAITRIEEIASDLLKKYKGESAHPSVKVPCSVNRLAQEVLSELQLQIREGVKIEFNSTNNSALAEVNPVELKRVLSNLINNAVEAIVENGCVRLIVDIHQAFITIKVQDNGRGIPKEVLPLLGQPGRTYGKKNGTGLGLFHARQTVESWGGRLSIESTLGQGTTVTLQLPIFPHLTKTPHRNLELGSDLVM